MVDRKYITKIIAAALLGKGDIKSDNGYVKFTILSRNEKFLLFLEDTLKSITSCVVYTDLLVSKRHPFFIKFRERMYGTGRKSVDPHYLKLLDQEFLTIFYIASDSEDFLDTSAFSYAENYQLRGAIKKYLGIDLNIEPYRSKSGNLFYKLVPREEHEIKFYDLMNNSSIMRMMR